MKSTYNEDLYTTPLVINDIPVHIQQRADAIAREIMGNENNYSQLEEYLEHDGDNPDEDTTLIVSNSINKNASRDLKKRDGTMRYGGKHKMQPDTSERPTQHSASTAHDEDNSGANVEKGYSHNGRLLEKQMSHKIVSYIKYNLYIVFFYIECKCFEPGASRIEGYFKITMVWNTK